MKLKCCFTCVHFRLMKEYCFGIGTCKYRFQRFSGCRTGCGKHTFPKPSLEEYVARYDLK